MIKIGLRSGGLVTIEDKKVDVSKATLDDIAYGIAGITRFTSQMDRNYSVAEHSVILSELIPPLEYDRRIAALWHDAAECLGISDVHHEVKPPVLKKLEERVLTALREKFKVPEFTDKDLDTDLGAFEAGNITPFKNHFPTELKLNVRFRHWSRNEAASYWKTAYQLYVNSRQYMTQPVPNLRPGVPFYLPNVANVERTAVEATVIAAGGRHVGEGKYVLQ